MKDERKRRTSAPDKYTNTSLLRGPSAILGSEIKHTRLGSIERCGIDIEQLQVVRKETGYDGLQWIVEGGFRWVCEVDGRGVEGVGYDERCVTAKLARLVWPGTFLFLFFILRDHLFKAMCRWFAMISTEQILLSDVVSPPSAPDFGPSCAVQNFKLERLTDPYSDHHSQTFSREANRFSLPS